jgi:3-dehydroquinate synthase
VVSGVQLTLATPYPIFCSPGALDLVGTVALEHAPAHRYAIIVDDMVAGYYLDRVCDSLQQFVPRARCVVASVPSGEMHKTREQWARLTDILLAAGCGRDTAIIALGGGVVGDLAGFVAATFMRGIQIVQIPTTLLAMVDASVGGKTGVDIPAGKNLVGAFHPPAAVIVDPTTLRTLPERHLRGGLAEALKHGVVADAAYFGRVRDALPSIGADAETIPDLLLPIIADSIAIKSEIVARDPRETGLRKVLNFGHTVGHAVEAVSGYELLHGEAIAIGMVVESGIATALGVTDGSLWAPLRDALAAAGLPTALDSALSRDDIISLMYHDKKTRRGNLELSLPTRIGAMAGAENGWSVPVGEAVVRSALGG